LSLAYSWTEPELRSLKLICLGSAALDAKVQTHPNPGMGSSPVPPCHFTKTHVSVCDSTQDGLQVVLARHRQPRYGMQPDCFRPGHGIASPFAQVTYLSRWNTCRDGLRPDQRQQVSPVLMASPKCIFVPSSFLIHESIVIRPDVLWCLRDRMRQGVRQEVGIWPTMARVSTWKQTVLAWVLHCLQA
jgi:hypothetical protein